jgi:hypothetical protein
MTASQTICTQFGGASCGAPCSEADIVRAERLLGCRLPDELRSLYLAFDGFRGPTEARFLWPLFAKEGLVDFNRFLREGSEFPHEFVASCIFFGDAGIGDMWGLKRDLPGQVIRWSASWGEDFEIAGASPIEVWLIEKKSYEIENRG